MQGNSTPRLWKTMVQRLWHISCFVRHRADSTPKHLKNVGDPDFSLPPDDGGDPDGGDTRDTLYQRTMAVTQGYSLPADDGGDPGILSTSGRWR